MSSTALAIKAGEIQLNITAGPHAGQVLTFNKDVISLGRDPDNDVVFSLDSKVSRIHAQIRLVKGKFVLVNLSQKNPIIVDGQEITQCELAGVRVIQIGDSELKVVTASQSTRAPLQILNSTSHANQHLPDIGKKLSPHPTIENKGQQKPSSASIKAIPPNSFKAQSSNPAQNDKIIFYIVVATIAGGLIWLLSDGDKQQKNITKIRTASQITQEITDSESLTQNIEKKMAESGKQTIQYQTAQEHYLKGFRDYRLGQYARAISSFQAALSFYPQHELAGKYYTLAKRKLDEQIQFNMIQGRRYRGKNNFRLCKSAYAKVLIMVKDPNDPIYKEAKQYYNECSLLLEDRY